jgi:hypothetical protein
VAAGLLAAAASFYDAGRCVAAIVGLRCLLL